MTTETTGSLDQAGKADSYARFLPGIIIESVVRGELLDKAGTESFPCAAMFADISGFTPLTARYARDRTAGPEKLTAVLNDYFTDLVRIVAEHGGDVLKFAGDAVLAIWRDGEADRDLAFASWRAAQCGLAIQGALRDYRVGPDALSLRVAIGAGSARIVHLGGVRGRWEFLFAGKPLDQVARVGDLIEPGCVGISARTRDLLATEVDAAPDCVPLTDGVLELRGIEALAPRRRWSADVDLAPHSARLRGYIPAAVARRIDAGQGAWIGELRTLTVLFVNLPDIDYRASVELAQQIMVALQESCYRYEGSINKLSVDDKGVSLLAALGLPPLAHEDDPDRGIRVALTIVDALRSMDIRCSVGVSTGRVYCGVVGAPERREYTIMGDAVNLAARLMQRADGGILSDESTWKGASAGIAFGEPRTLRLKGRGEADTVHAPLAIVDGIEKEDGAGAATPAMVGRVAEREALAGALDELVRGNSGVVFIEADAGFGKSRLLRHLREAARSAQVTVCAAAADAIERATPYYTIRGLLLDVLTAADARREHPAVTPETLVERLHALLPEADFRAHMPLLASFLPLGLEETPFTEQFTGEARALRIAELVVEILRRTTEAAPLLMAIDDVHWLDAASAGVLRRIQQALAPLLMVVTTRPMVDPPRELEQLRKEARSLHLERLSNEEIRELVCRRLGTDALPELVASLLAERADGHPYHSEELALALVDAGVLRIEDGRCEFEGEFELADVEIPRSIEGLITSRIDRLTPEQAFTIKIASVIGRRFSLEQLRQLHPASVERSELLAELEEFERLHLTPRQTDGEDPAYFFKQGITQEVAHSLLLKEQSRRLHAELAEQYERCGDHPLALLAHHWERADEPERAFGYLRRAVDQALVGFANQDAVLLADRALALGRRFDAPERDLGLLLSGRGRALFALGRPNEGADSLSRALRSFGEPMPTSMAALAIGIVRQAFRRWRFAAASHAAPPSSREAQRLVDAADAYAEIQVIYYYRSDGPRTMYSALRGSNLGCASGRTPPSLVRMNANLGMVSGLLPSRRMAAWFLDLAAAQAVEVDDAPTTAWVEIVAGTYGSGIGAWDDSLERFARALAILEALGEEGTRAAMLTARAKMLLIMGHHEAARAAFASFHANARSRSAPQAICWSALGQARVHLRRGELEQAQALLDEAAPLLDVLPFNQRMDHHSMTAIMRLLAGDPESAEASVAAGCALLERPSQVMMIFAANHLCHAVIELVAHYRQTGGAGRPPLHLRRHWRRLMRFLSTYARIYPPGAAHRAYQRGRWAALTGHEAAAVKRWREALATAERFGVEDVYAAAAARLAEAGVDGADPERLAEAQRHTGLEAPFRPY
ncbi:MAG: adenylate/guanylate cyclase domain-containing protein [Pseudomonadales bacterium]|nr:adenylate/guanylate cyclase domain-containing protein [Pseudomonadales bacterium]